jgi:hypothetical protein
VKKIFLIFSLLVFSIYAVSGQNITGRGESYNIDSLSNGTFSLSIRLFQNFFNGTLYVPLNTTILNTTYLGYKYGLTASKYKVYFLTNTNLDSPLRYEKNGYYFIYDISQGELKWIGRPGQPSATDTLGSGASSNSLDTIANVSNNKISYKSAYFNTTVEYELRSDNIKETFILTGLPNIKSYDYLQYSGNIRFNSSLKICTDRQCYIPKGTQDDFETNGKIYFKNTNNTTIFYLKEPIIKDAAGRTTFGLYSVHGSNAQMNFWLRINTTWLQNATFPIYIDPTITIGDDNSVIINLSDDIYNPLQEIILNNVSGDGTILFDTQIVDSTIRYAINPINLSFSSGSVYVRNATTTHLLKCPFWDYYAETCGVNNTLDWQTVELLSSGQLYSFDFNNNDPAYAEVSEDYDISSLNYILQNINTDIIFSTKILHSANPIHILTDDEAYAVNNITCGMILNNTDTGKIIISTVMPWDDFTETYKYNLLITPNLYFNMTGVIIPDTTNYINNIVCTGGELGETTKTDVINVQLFT